MDEKEKKKEEGETWRWPLREWGGLESFFKLFSSLVRFVCVCVFFWRKKPLVSSPKLFFFWGLKLRVSER